MSHNFITPEQMLYSQLAIAEGILEYIYNNLEECEFNNNELLLHLKMALLSTGLTSSCMKSFFNQTKECCVCG